MPEKFRPELDLNPDLSDAVLNRLSYHANWEQVVIQVHDSPLIMDVHLCTNFMYYSAKRATVSTRPRFFTNFLKIHSMVV